MLKQQQDMLSTMAALLPGSGTSVKETVNTENRPQVLQAHSPGAGRKRARATQGSRDSSPSAKRLNLSSDGKSEGELSDHGDSGADRDFEDFVATERSEEDSDPYEDISAFFVEKELLGTEVAEPTAKLVNSALKAVITQAKEKELLGKVLRPANCEALIVPKINTEVWRELKREVREADSSMQRIQTLLHRGLGPLVSVMDTLRNRKDKEMVSKLGEAFRLLALASARLSQKRKDQIAPELDPAIRTICASNRPVTSELFGDDLPKTLKEVREARQLGDKLTSAPYRQGQRGRQSFRGGHSSGTGFREQCQSTPRGRGAFLGKQGSRGGRSRQKLYRGNREEQSHRR